MSRQIQAKLVITAEDLSAAGFASVANKLNAVEKNTQKTTAELKKLPSAIKLVDMAFDAMAKGAQLAWGHIAGIVTEMSALQDASDRFGVSAQTFSRFQFVAKQTGTDLGAVEKGFAKISQGIVNNSKEFAAWGVKTRDARGHTLSLEQVLAQIPGRLSSITDGAQRAAMAQDLLGKGGTQLLPVLLQYEELALVADQLGITISSSTVAAFDQFGDTIDMIQAGIGAFVRDLATSGLPVMQTFADLIVGAIKNIREGLGATFFQDLSARFLEASIQAVQMSLAFASAFDVIRQVAKDLGVTLPKVLGAIIPQNIKTLVGATIGLADRMRTLGTITEKLGLGGKDFPLTEQAKELLATLQAARASLGGLHGEDIFGAGGTGAGKQGARKDKIDQFGPTREEYEQAMVTAERIRKRDIAMTRAWAKDIKEIRGQSAKATKAFMIQSGKEELAQAERWSRFVEGPMTHAAIGLKNAFIDAFTGAADFGKSILNLMGAVVDSIINSLISMGVQWLLSNVLFKTVQISQALSAITASSAVASAAAFAAYAGIPVFGPIIGAGAATAAGSATMAYAAKLAPIAGFEQGGEILNTGLATVHRGEAVIPAPVVQAVMQNQAMGSAARRARGGSSKTVNVSMQTRLPPNRGELKRYMRDVVKPVLRDLERT